MITGGVTFHMIFEQEYIRPDGTDDHVFRDLQYWYRNKVNSMLGIEIPSSPSQARLTQSNANANVNATANVNINATTTTVTTSRQKATEPPQ